jgi:hypothetical protein
MRERERRCRLDSTSNTGPIHRKRLHRSCECRRPRVERETLGAYCSSRVLRALAVTCLDSERWRPLTGTRTSPQERTRPMTKCQPVRFAKLLPGNVAVDVSRRSGSLRCPPATGCRARRCRRTACRGRERTSVLPRRIQVWSESRVVDSPACRKSARQVFEAFTQVDQLRRATQSASTMDAMRRDAPSTSSHPFGCARGCDRVNSPCENRTSAGNHLVSQVHSCR